MYKVPQIDITGVYFRSRLTLILFVIYKVYIMLTINELMHCWFSNILSIIVNGVVNKFQRIQKLSNTLLKEISNKVLIAKERIILCIFEKNYNYDLPLF